MQADLFVLRADKVVDDVGTGGPAAGIAKPLATSRKVATDHASRVVNSTIHARPFGQHFVDLINVFFHELVLKVELVFEL
jgi:hypothetical protein